MIESLYELRLTLSVAGEIRELTILWNKGNNFQEKREHICEITKNMFRQFHLPLLINTAKQSSWEKTEICFLNHVKTKNTLFNNFYENVVEKLKIVKKNCFLKTFFVLRSIFGYFTNKWFFFLLVNSQTKLWKRRIGYFTPVTKLKYLFGYFTWFVKSDIYHLC